MDPKLEDVFGVGRAIMLSYVERPDVNHEFVQALKHPRHIIVYGSSKQGKSSLIGRHLNPDQYVVVGPGENTKVGDMYASIVRQEKIPVKEVLEYGTRKKTMIKAQATLKMRIPIVGGEGKIGGDTEAEDSTKYELTPVDFNLNHAQDVCELLKTINFSKSIVLENFHYLQESVQKTLSVDLRIFLDYGIRFIILGIWRERNRLAQYNGDLVDRMKEIPVDPWETPDMDRVSASGAEKLNITLDPRLLDKVKEISFQSIGVFQELCKELCIANGITERQENNVQIGDHVVLSKAIERKVKDYGERHISALRSFVRKSPKDKRPQPSMSFYLVRAILDSRFDQIVRGVSREHIEEKIKAIYKASSGFRAGELSNLLHSLSSFQSDRKIWPPLFDYDQTARVMRVIDSTFFFYLRHAKEKIFKEIIEASSS